VAWKVLKEFARQKLEAESRGAREVDPKDLSQIEEGNRTRSRRREKDAKAKVTEALGGKRGQWKRRGKDKEPAED